MMSSDYGTYGQVEEKVLGKEHQNTLTSVDNLAEVKAQGALLGREKMLGEAAEMGRRALSERERVLGKEHPDTLMRVSSLAMVLGYQGNHEEAEAMNRRALSIS